VFALCDFLPVLLGVHFYTSLLVPVLAECLLGVFLYRVWFCCYVLDLLLTFLFVVMLFDAVVRYSNEESTAALDLRRMGPFRLCRTLCPFHITHYFKYRPTNAHIYY
jgi:hypothetical protein